MATAWQSNKLLDPMTDGAVLPILHLNGYKISNPTVLAPIEHEELDQFLRGCGWTPYFVEGDDPATMHELMATVLDGAIEGIRQFQTSARATRAGPSSSSGRPRAGLARRLLTGFRSREPSGRTRCSSASIPSIPSMSRNSKPG